MIGNYFNILLAKVYRSYAVARHFISRYPRKRFFGEYRLVEIPAQFESLNSQYLYFHQRFWTSVPLWLRQHRKYFTLEQRGFGEDAFHAMWLDILSEYKPKRLLEIGVYRGQVISLWSLIAKHRNIDCTIHAISPFSPAADDVSVYLSDIDYYGDVIRNFNHFGLPLPHLHKGLSTDSAMRDVIKSDQWDLIYIDGSHDYEVVKRDFENCSKMLATDGLLVLDDAAVGTSFNAPPYASNGHPGPSQVASEIDRSLFEEILSVGHNRVFRKT